MFSPDDFTSRVGARGFTLFLYLIVLWPLSILFFVFLIKKILDKSPVLSVNEEGIWHRDWKVGIIPWTDIEEVYEAFVTFSHRGFKSKVWYIALKIHNGKNYLQRHYEGGKFLDSEVDSFFRINANGLNIKHSELLERLKLSLSFQKHK